MITPDWTDDQPIYRQLKDKLVGAIIDGSLEEGNPLPSVRTMSVELEINPLTASKAYQELVADGLVEKRRGLGMFVSEGAREKLLGAERRRGLEQEWPRILERIESLGLSLSDLPQSIDSQKGQDR